MKEQIIDINHRVQDYNKILWLHAILATGMEIGIYNLDEATTVEALAQRFDLPTNLLDPMIEIGLSAGLIEKHGNTLFRPSWMSGTELDLGFFLAKMKVAEMQSRHFFSRIVAGERNFVWDSTNQQLVVAQGRLGSFELVRTLVERVLPEMPGLMRRLEEAGAAMLDVGAGAATLSICLAEHWPRATVVGLEPAPAASSLARRQIARAELDSRIEIRPIGVERLEDRDRYDLAWFPQVFIPAASVRPGLQRVLQALKPGGWIWLLTTKRCGTAQDEAVLSIRTQVMGGSPMFPDEAGSLLREIGFEAVSQVQNQAIGEYAFMVGRRP